MCGVKALHPAQMIYCDSIANCDRPPKNGALVLAQVASGMFYSVVANRRQPNLCFVVLILRWFDGLTFVYLFFSMF